MKSRLPPLLAEIAGVARDAAAVQLAAKVGGVKVYIPARAEPDHWLVECVGRAAADKVCAHFASDGRGRQVCFPLGPAATHKQLLRVIAQRVHELDDGSRSSREIARTVGITQRSIHKHRAKHRGGGGDRRQGSLF
ncbi:MAG: hypothetical protein WD871_01725 [Xanthobacteraceae bacterium]